MNYHNILCVGDSQTFGARTYGCYPLHLASILTEKSPYEWRAVNYSVNGHTARDLWFMLNQILDGVDDTCQACVLIGANDAGEGKDPALFEEYYRQVLRAFFVKRYKAVYCGEIPPIRPDGHVYFDRGTADRREMLNQVISKVVSEYPGARLVRFGELGADFFEDPVHFNEAGNRRVAEAFAEEILER